MPLSFDHQISFIFKLLSENQGNNLPFSLKSVVTITDVQNINYSKTRLDGATHWWKGICLSSDVLSTDEEKEKNAKNENVLNFLPIVLEVPSFPSTLVDLPHPVEDKSRITSNVSILSATSL